MKRAARMRTSAAFREFTPAQIVEWQQLRKRLGLSMAIAEWCRLRVARGEATVHETHAARSMAALGGAA